MIYAGVAQQEEHRQLAFFRVLIVSTARGFDSRHPHQGDVCAFNRFYTTPQTARNRWQPGETGSIFRSTADGLPFA